ncbi:MAG: biopolymer transporter ExbD [Polaromonas sp.]|jgi:biopolymer transport protein TolR|nr:biopolymer transporter ExbD [Polaromonas sp.]MBP6157011.1 biopolymer transporter ExbD [Polaromonas sp.]MBP7114853.1 biopolymer transporter ExbD [Polaromonas sp.]
MSFGRLNSTNNVKPMSDINMTPLIDVMLVLLVIFILTAPLMTSAIKLDLPKTSATNPVDAPNFVTVVIDKNGQVFLNEQATSLTQLADSLKQIAIVKSDTEVQLRADETVAYGKVAEVMGVTQQAGLNRIGFVTQSQQQVPNK